MRSIGIPVADRPECLIALEQAFSLAKITGADVQGYHIRPDRNASKDVSLGQLLLGDDTLKLWSKVNLAQEKKAAVSAREMFTRMAEKHGMSIGNKRGKPGSPAAVFIEKTGTPDKLMPLIGPVNDMLVVSRPDSDKSTKAISILSSALMNSHVPVLVLPRKVKDIKLDHLVLGWNRGKTETILMHNALPLLEKATKVTVLSIGSDHNHGPSGREAAAYLKGYGIKATQKRVLDANIGRSIGKTFREVKGDIMLCGAYTHGQLRETMFGGVTRYLLDNTEMPVVFQHV